MTFRAPFAKKAKAGDAEEEVTTVHCAGLSYDATEEDIKGYFESCGSVKTVRLPIFADSGKKKGFAFIEFDSAESVDKALELDGQTWMDRWLKITVATAKQPNSSTAPHDKPLSERPEGCKTLFVANLSWDVTEDDVRSHFESCGEIWSVRVGWDREKDQFKGFMHVEFVEEESATKGMALYGSNLKGRDIRIDYSAPREGYSRNQGSGCHKCGEEGHFSRECPAAGGEAGGHGGGRGSRGGRGDRGRGRGGRGRDSSRGGSRGGRGGRGNSESDQPQSKKMKF